MHVRESVKDFIHDVKHKFSRKHKRDSCSTCTTDSYDGASSDSTSDSLSHVDTARFSVWSSSTSPPERGRLVTFVRSRTRSGASAKFFPNVLQKAKRTEGKERRVFSSESATNASRSDRTRTAARTIRRVDGSLLSIAYVAEEQGMSRRPGFEYPDVLDIRARSVETSVEGESIQPASHDSTALFDKASSSDTSGTLVSGSDIQKSVSKSDTLSSSIDVLSLPSSAPPSMVQATVPLSDPPADLREDVSHPPPTVTSPAITPATSASPPPVYIPRLTAPSMFLPIPNTDPLSALLTKHVSAEQRPRRDIVGEYAGRDVHEMVMSNSWRALARMARDRIVASDPEDLARILDLWSLRLSSLARLRLTNQASAECTNLFAVLNAVPPTPVPGSFLGSGSLSPSVSHPFSTSSAASLPLSPSGLSGLAQLPGTPSQKPSTLSPLPAGISIPATALRQGANDFVYPFELTVFHARVHYWSGDPLGYVDALSQILGRCKERAREEGQIAAQRKALTQSVKARDMGTSQLGRASKAKAMDGDKEDAEVAEESTESTEDQDDEEEEPDDLLVAAEANLSMWLERIARVCLMLASQMVEMNDYQAAINLLVPLCTHRTSPGSVPSPSPALHSALARVYLLSGNLQKAEEHFSIAASATGDIAKGTDIVVMNSALLAAASGDWTLAEKALADIVSKDPGNFTAINNLAVTLLYQGRIKEGIDLLEAALKTSPSAVVVAEPFLFNLSTLYELRSTAAIDKKRGLLVEVAKWSGDGLRTSCLKMPSS